VHGTRHLLVQVQLFFVEIEGLAALEISRLRELFHDGTNRHLPIQFHAAWKTCLGSVMLYEG
jgi:hypothetical protein